MQGLDFDFVRSLVRTVGSRFHGMVRKLARSKSDHVTMTLNAERASFSPTHRPELILRRLLRRFRHSASLSCRFLLSSLFNLRINHCQNWDGVHG